MKNYLYDGIQTNKIIPFKHRTQTGLQTINQCSGHWPSWYLNIKSVLTILLVSNNVVEKQDYNIYLRLYLLS